MTVHEVLDPPIVEVRPPISPIRRLAASSIAPNLVLLAALGVLIVVNLITQPTFGSWLNITNLMRSTATPLLIAAAGTLVLLTAGVDLSVGATLGFSGVFYAQLVTSGVPTWPALLLTLLAGGAIGLLINGFLIGRVGMSFFVVTLGAGSFLRGVTFVWSGNRSIGMADDELSATLGNTAIFGGRIPVAFLVALGAVAVLWLVLRYTTFGRSVYAVGGNREAAELSGVRTGWTIGLVYGIVAVSAALAGVMMIGRQTLADPNAGTGIELTVASGILLGGVALAGGVGSVWGAALGVTFLALLANTLALRGVSANWQLVVTGAILIIAVYFDRVRQRLGTS